VAIDFAGLSILENHHFFAPLSKSASFARHCVGKA
jgi:hypothetical protein